MKKLIAFFLLSSQVLFAQSGKKKVFPNTAAGLQFAGSIGWLSAGYSRQSANQTVELGLIYGYTPKAMGGEIHTLALKLKYEPFRIPVSPDFQLEPLQAGAFVAQNFGKNLYITWPEKYKSGYYWWRPSTRFHVFLGTQASYLCNSEVIRKISIYFEANTNDLYWKSYSSNHNSNSLSFYDIIFFGIGSKVYFK